MAEMMNTRKRNKVVNKLVRDFLLQKRYELSRKLNDNRWSIKKLAKEQAELKPALAEINRQIDELGIRINEEK